MLTHLSLFSGIGGLDLAAEWAGFTTVGQCEFADYPYKILQNHWPDVPKWRDVHDLSADEFVRQTGIEPGQLDCISGGFPCQPHSVAGKRKASGDDRDLWPEYRRVVNEIKPKWVVAENVRGLLSSENGRFFRGILRDFAVMGYDVGWCCFRAADVGAIHARERIAIVAYRHNDGFEKWALQIHEEKRDLDQVNHHFAALLSEFSYQNPPGIFRSGDGIPCWVDRVRCLGNAIVPQQFYPIFKAIEEIEHRKVHTAGNKGSKLKMTESLNNANMGGL